VQDRKLSQDIIDPLGEMKKAAPGKIDRQNNYQTDSG
jgi:hypothetical protein